MLVVALLWTLLVFVVIGLVLMAVSIFVPQRVNELEHVEGPKMPERPPLEGLTETRLHKLIDRVRDESKWAK